MAELVTWFDHGTGSSFTFSVKRSRKLALDETPAPVAGVEGSPLRLALESGEPTASRENGEQ